MVQPAHDATLPLECYAVPTDVGKIGKESPTFIEPVANRKDGLEAMFSKQAAKMSATPKLEPGVASSSSHKRKQEEISSSPPRKGDVKDEMHDVPLPPELPPPDKKPKIEDVSSPVKKKAKQVSEGRELIFRI